MDLEIGVEEADEDKVEENGSLEDEATGGALDSVDWNRRAWTAAGLNVFRVTYKPDGLGFMLTMHEESTVDCRSNNKG